MIIFTDKIFRFGDPKSIRYFNLNSYFMNLIDVTALMPSPNLLDRIGDLEGLESQQFDNLYANEIMSDSSKFCALMRIMEWVAKVPYGIAVVLIEDSPFRNAIKESLMKFIDFRYGYPCFIVNDECEDLEFIASVDSDFSIDGMINFTTDEERYYSETLPPDCVSQLDFKENAYVQQKGRLPLPSETL